MSSSSFNDIIVSLTLDCLIYKDHEDRLWSRGLGLNLQNDRKAEMRESFVHQLHKEETLLLISAVSFLKEIKTQKGQGSLRRAATHYSSYF